MIGVSFSANREDYFLSCYHDKKTIKGQETQSLICFSFVYLGSVLEILNSTETAKARKISISQSQVSALPVFGRLSKLHFQRRSRIRGSSALGTGTSADEINLKLFTAVG